MTERGTCAQCALAGGLAALALLLCFTAAAAIVQGGALAGVLQAAIGQAGPWRLLPLSALLFVCALGALAWQVRTHPAAADVPQHAPLDGSPELDVRESGLTARIQGALSAQRAFVADAAHELRSPLTALKLQIQIAERAESPEARLAAFAKVHQRLDRSVHLVQQLLTLARHERPVAPPELKPLDLVVLAQEVVADRSLGAAGRRIDLGVVFSAHAPVTVRANAEGMAALLGNLVDNALRHVPDAGKVDVSVYRRDGQTCLEVSDNGPGVPDAARPRLFDRFYRGEEPSGRGAGLGLAIVKSIADYHDARLELCDNAAAGHGLVVRVIFGQDAGRTQVTP